MGTTSPKGLRYPEATTEARTLHTRIKELADDVNTVFTTQDTRLTGLESKTTTTQNNLNANGLVVGRYGHCAGVFTHSPNDGVIRTISQHIDYFYIPYTATRVMISMMSTAFAAVNAAGAWYPLVSLNTGGVNWQGMGEYATHNQTQPAIDLGFSAVAEFDVRSYRGNYGSVAVNAYCAPQSGGWITNGYLRWSATLIS